METHERLLRHSRGPKVLHTLGLGLHTKDKFGNLTVINPTPIHWSALLPKDPKLRMVDYG